MMNKDEKNGERTPWFSICTVTDTDQVDLDRLYGNLKEQSLQDFEWIIVGDGAPQAVRDEASRIAAEADFPVVYLFQKKKGRAAALNRGLEEAKGRFFIVLDLGTRPVPDALEKLAGHWKSIPEQERSYFVSVAGLVALNDGTIYGSKFPSSPFDSNSIETSTHYGVGGRKWGFLRTEVVRGEGFPVFQGEDFFPDQLVLNRIGQRAITRYVNDVVLILEKEEPPSRREELRRWIENPKASAKYYNEFSGMRLPLAHKVRACANYVRYSMHAGVIPDDIFKAANKRLITFFMLWPGLIAYKRDRKKMRRV
ncbi:MAG TPA: glycosyltransferase [Sediminispirochaeta sp.]|nr:glycosyltransferase [Sediminispirochaeta sp.]